MNYHASRPVCFLKVISIMVILQEREAPPPGLRPPMAWGLRRDTGNHCWQQVALVTRCGGGRMFPDVLSLHSSSSSSHKHRAELLPRLEDLPTRREERPRSRITYRCSRISESLCLHSCFPFQSTCVYFLSESAKRDR